MISSKLSRRSLLHGACVAPLLPFAGCLAGGAPAGIVSRPTDIRVVDVDHQFEEFVYRAPYQFGGRPVDPGTIPNVNCPVRTGKGREAWGVWAVTPGDAR